MKMTLLPMANTFAAVWHGGCEPRHQMVILSTRISMAACRWQLGGGSGGSPKELLPQLLS